jgi:hypothetical protein
VAPAAILLLSIIGIGIGYGTWYYLSSADQSDIATVQEVPDRLINAPEANVAPSAGSSQGGAVAEAPPAPNTAPPPPATPEAAPTEPSTEPQTSGNLPRTARHTAPPVHHHGAGALPSATDGGFETDLRCRIRDSRRRRRWPETLPLALRGSLPRPPWQVLETVRQPRAVRHRHRTSCAGTLTVSPRHHYDGRTAPPQAPTAADGTAPSTGDRHAARQRQPLRLRPPRTSKRPDRQRDPSAPAGGGAPEPASPGSRRSFDRTRFINVSRHLITITDQRRR